jgi:hypothetical protein
VATSRRSAAPVARRFLRDPSPVAARTKQWAADDTDGTASRGSIRADPFDPRDPRSMRCCAAGRCRHVGEAQCQAWERGASGWYFLRSD